MLPINTFGGNNIKKLIAIFGIIFVLSSALAVRAEITTSSTPIPDGKITLGFLEQITSWEELYNVVHPILVNLLNRDLKYCVNSLECIMFVQKTRIWDGYTQKI